MSLRSEISAINSSLVCNTGLLAEAFSLTRRDSGETINFDGTLAATQSDEEREDVVLHAPQSVFTTSPSLMDVVTRLSDGHQFFVAEIFADLGFYRLELSREERFSR